MENTCNRVAQNSGTNSSRSRVPYNCWYTAVSDTILIKFDGLELLLSMQSEDFT